MPLAPSSRRPWWRSPALWLTVAMCAVYWPNFGGEVWIVDDPNIIHESVYNLSTPANWYATFVQPYGGDYKPIGHATILAEAAIFGPRQAQVYSDRQAVENAKEFAVIVGRLGNLMFHLLGVWLTWLVLRRLSPHQPRVAAFAAAVFALHPLAVECVEWLTGRYTLVSYVFGLAAAWSYLRWRQGPWPLKPDVVPLSYVAWIRRQHVPPNRRPAWGWLALSAVLLVLGMASKAWAIAIAGWAVLAEWTVLRQRHETRLGVWIDGALRPWPLFVCAVAFGVFSAILVTGVGTQSVSWGDNLRIHLPLLWTYLMNFLAPVGLSFFYATPDYTLLEFVGWVAAAIGLLGGWWWLAGANREATMAVGWLLGPLSFALGLLPFQWGHIADRYFYFSLAPASWLACLAAAAVWRRLSARFQSPVAQAFVAYLGRGLALLTLTGLAVMTFAQAAVWRSPDRIMEHAVVHHPQSSLVHHHIGYAQAMKLDQTRSTLSQDQIDAANAIIRRHYAQATECPDFSIALTQLRQVEIFCWLIKHDPADPRAAQWLDHAEQIAKAVPMLWGAVADVYVAHGQRDRAAKVLRQVFAGFTLTPQLLDVAKHLNWRPWRVTDPRWFYRQGDGFLKIGLAQSLRPIMEHFPVLAAERGWNEEAFQAAMIAAAVFPDRVRVLVNVRSALEQIQADAAIRADLAEYLESLTPQHSSANSNE